MGSRCRTPRATCTDGSCRNRAVTHITPGRGRCTGHGRLLPNVPSGRRRDRLAVQTVSRHMPIFRRCVGSGDATILVTRCSRPDHPVGGDYLMLLTHRRLVVTQQTRVLHRLRLHLNTELRELSNVTWSPDPRPARRRAGRHRDRRGPRAVPHPDPPPEAGLAARRAAQPRLPDPPPRRPPSGWSPPSASRRRPPAGRVRARRRSADRVLTGPEQSPDVPSGPGSVIMGR